MASQTLDAPTVAAPRLAKSLSAAVPTWALVLLSRALALFAGVLGSSLFSAVSGWHQNDPTSISTHLGAVGNLLAGSMVRWDAIHYLQIAAHGYSTPGDTVFFPLYPALIAALAAIVGSGALAGALISSASFGVALLLLHRLTVLELGVPGARATVILLAFAPTAFFFSADYSESLFLALSLGAFLAARRERWLAAGVCAAAATLTRVPGVLLLAPLLLMYLDARRRRPSPASVRGMLPLALIPLALIAFLLYLDARGFGLLAPVTNQVVIHGHGSAGPVATITRAFRDALQGLWQLLTGAEAPVVAVTGRSTAALSNVTELAVLVISVAALVQAFRRLPRAYGVYSLLVLALCVWSPSPIVPLLSLNRYVLVIFPLWMVAGEALCRRRLVLPTAVLGAGLMAIYVFEFARWAFIA